MRSRKINLFKVCIALFLLLESCTFAADLPEGVVPITQKPSPENLLIRTDEARQLYNRIRNKDYPSVEELRNSNVIAQLDAISNYYKAKYGSTADINTPEREELRERIVKEFLCLGSARLYETQDGKLDYAYDNPVKKDFQLELVLGRPAIGKSHTITDQDSEKMGAFVLDVDIIKHMIPECAESFGGAEDAVHFEGMKIMNMAIKEFLSGSMKGDNVILPLAATNLDNLMTEYIKPFEDAGYEVRAKFIDAPEYVSVSRNAARQLDKGRIFNSAVAFSFGNKPKELWLALKDKTNSKGEPYGVELSDEEKMRVENYLGITLNN